MYSRDRLNIHYHLSCTLMRSWYPVGMVNNFGMSIEEVRIWWAVRDGRGHSNECQVGPNGTEIGQCLITTICIGPVSLGLISWRETRAIASAPSYEAAKRKQRLPNSTRLLVIRSIDSSIREFKSKWTVDYLLIQITSAMTAVLLDQLSRLSTVCWVRRIATSQFDLVWRSTSERRMLPASTPWSAESQPPM